MLRLPALLLLAAALLPMQATLSIGSLLGRAQAAGQEERLDPLRHSIAGPRRERAQTQVLDRAYFIGVWESKGVEFGRDIQIFWTVRNDGSLDYDFVVDGAAFRGSTGTWDFRDGTLYESWVRADGTTGSGRAAIERIDDNTFRLTVIDNGAPEYQGLVRIYKRKAAPQTVNCAGCRAGI